jgi:hypothetical protein
MRGEASIEDPSDNLSAQRKGMREDLEAVKEEGKPKQVQRCCYQVQVATTAAVIATFCMLLLLVCHALHTKWSGAPGLILKA